MRSLFLVLLLTLGLVSTSLSAMAPKAPVIPGTTTSSDTAQINPYYQRFQELGKTYGAAFVAKSVSFFFGAFVGATVGMCRFTGRTTNTVELSRSAWNSGSETFKEMLVFHELGHCLLGRDHKNSRHSDGRQESLMASAMFSERVYNANRDAYLKELFTAENNSQRRSAFRVNETAASPDPDPCQFGAKR